MEKFKPSNHNLTYVHDIHNEIKLESQDLSINPPLVYKNN